MAGFTQPIEEVNDALPDRSHPVTPDFDSGSRGCGAAGTNATQADTTRPIARPALQIGVVGQSKRESPLFESFRCCSILLFLVTATTAQAAPGDLDSSFDGDGKTVTELSEAGSARAVGIDPEGRIVAAGTSGSSSQTLVRYLADGSLDASFGDGGVAIYDVFSVFLFSMEIFADSSILVGGSLNADFFTSIWSAGGELDTDYGVSGIAKTSFGNGSQDIAHAVAVLSGGRIVIAGRADAATTGRDFALAAFDPNGDLATSFGTNGKTQTDFDLSSDEAWAMALQGDDKIVLAGTTVVSDTDFGLARYTASGDLDPSFGDDGLVRTDFSGAGSRDEARAVVIQPSDGYIVVGGRSDAAGNTDFALARYDPTGNLDPSFGVGGLVTFDIGSVSDEIRGLGLQSDEKIVAVGRNAPTGADDDFVVARFNSDGSIDRSFGPNGFVLTDITDMFRIDDARAVAIQADDRIVVVGQSAVGGKQVFAAARYLAVPEPGPVSLALSSLMALSSIARARRRTAGRPNFWTAYGARRIRALV